jgi:transcriptional regulator with XRE-family HTH domain
MQLYEIGGEIAKRRLELQLTQEQLAKLAGLSRLTINQLESGKVQDLGVNKLIPLLSVLGLELNTQPRHSGTGLFKATVSANVSYEKDLTPEQLARALATGEIPHGFESQLSTILDETPLPIVVKAVEEASSRTGVQPKKMWKHLADWSRSLHLYRRVWG